MKRITLKFIFAVLCLCNFAQVQAQRSPLVSQYYINPYIVNPSMAGLEQVIRINATLRTQKQQMPGAPVTQNLTADYGFDKLGIGLNLNNDKAGLLGETRFMGTFAYHLPLDGEEQFLHFGISAGILNQRVDLGELNGNDGDVVVGQYNNQQNYLDGDFGLAYSAAHFTLQGAILNMKHFFKKDVFKITNQQTFYTSATYRVGLPGLAGADLSPLLALRGAEDTKNVWDAGLKLSLANQQFNLSGLYHSDHTATVGLGLSHAAKYLINALYNFNTSGLGGNSNGNFELGLGLRL